MEVEAIYRGDLIYIGSEVMVEVRAGSRALSGEERHA
jgi:hypothetical protein